DGHAQVTRPLRLLHGVGDPRELVELALELGPLAEKYARRRRVARAGLLDQSRADRRRLGAGRVGEHTVRHDLGDQQFVVVPEPRDGPPLRLELLVGHGADLLQHLDHAEELLPVGGAQGLELPAADTEPLGRGLQLAPLAIAAGRRAPGTAMALDRGERGLRSLRALALHQLGHRETAELGGQVAEPAPLASPPSGTSPRARRPGGGGVAKTLRWMPPLSPPPAAPGGGSASMRPGCPRTAGTPSPTAGVGAPPRRTSTRRPGSASATGRSPRPPGPRPSA